MIFALCGSCMCGDHSKHIRHWGVRPEGVLDGEVCPCNGECEHMPTLFERMKFPSMAESITTTQREMFNCPACGKGVTATLTLSLELGDKISDSEMSATATISGLYIMHDCRPKMTR